MSKGCGCDIHNQDFSKAFDTVKTFSWRSWQLVVWMFHLVKNWMGGWAKGVVLNGVKSSWQLVISGAL